MSRNPSAIPQALGAAIECHERIFDAIAARDADRAEREMRRHLGDVETFYWTVRAPHETSGTAPDQKK